MYCIDFVSAAGLLFTVINYTVVSTFDRHCVHCVRFFDIHSTPLQTSLASLFLFITHTRYEVTHSLFCLLPLFTIACNVHRHVPVRTVCFCVSVLSSIEYDMI